MKNIFKSTLSLVILAIFFTACEKDNGKDPLFEYYQYENAAPYVRVITDIKVIDVTQLDASAVTFTVSVPVENVSSWSVKVMLDGSTTTASVDLRTVTSFPETFTYTVSELASAVGISLMDIAPGDKFIFSGESVGNDGRVLTANDLGPDLFGQPEQRNAYSFSVSISCPPLVLPLNPSDYVGTATITVDEWADYSIGDNIEVEAGSAANEVWIRQYDNPYISNPSTAYMILTIDTSTATIVVSSNEAFDYGQGPVGSVYGTGTIDGCGAIHLVTTYDLGVFGIYTPYKFDLEF